MKTKFILFILLFAVYHNMQSQPCLPDGIVFTSQQAIDNFHTNHPDCTKIGGFVSMRGQNITNLQGLSGITEIGSSLIIDSTLLSNFQGLNSLKKIGGSLLLSYNLNLDHFTGLDSLTTIGGEISAIFTGVQNFTGMPQIVSIRGLYLYFTGTKNMNGLEGITSLKGSINFRNCFELTNLTGLSNVRSVNKDISIEMTSLSSLKGLDSINPNSIDDLYIYSNDLLSECDVASICSYLAAPNGTVMIEYNATGCKTEAEVLEACITSAGEVPAAENLIQVYPNPVSNVLNISLNPNETLTEIRIINVFGETLVYKQGSIAQVDVSELTKGYYTVMVTSVQRSGALKFIKL
jgi:hypothetical protein